jgi:hypothetical protein
MTHFHNSIGLVQPELQLFNQKAENQEEVILQIFKDRPEKWLTPFHIQSIYKVNTGVDVPITSIRRGITNLCKSGKILKSNSASGKGVYGVKNHVWTLAI